MDAARFGGVGIVAGVGLLAYAVTARRGLPLTLLAVLSLAADVVTWNHVRELARRLPSRRVAGATKLLIWTAAAGAVMALFHGAHRMVFALLFPFFGGGGGSILWVLFLVLYPAISVTLLLRTAQLLRGAAVQGEKNWVSDPEFR